MQQQHQAQLAAVAATQITPNAAVAQLAAAAQSAALAGGVISGATAAYIPVSATVQQQVKFI